MDASVTKNDVLCDLALIWQIVNTENLNESGARDNLARFHRDNHTFHTALGDYFLSTLHTLTPARAEKWKSFSAEKLETLTGVRVANIREYMDMTTLQTLAKSYNFHSEEDVNLLFADIKARKTAAFQSTLGEIFARELFRNTTAGKRLHKRKTRAKIVTVLLGVLLISSVSIFGVLQYRTWQSSFKTAWLQKMATQTTEVPAIDEPTTVLPEYRSLYAINRDLAGWLTVDAIGLNLPVMQDHSNKDFGYYLSHDFFDDADMRGALFLDPQATLNPSDNVLVIYGHAMHDGSMFGNLRAFEDEAFTKQHPLFSFHTLSEKRTYEVVAVLKTRVRKTDERGFRYYACYGYQNMDEFNELTAFIESARLFDVGRSLTYGDEIVMLSTCDNAAQMGRLVVVGRRM